jgi:hypothetical protein
MTAETTSSVTGRFEVSTEKFVETTRGKPSDVQLIDIKDAVPEAFVNTTKIPRLLERVWRRACDEVMAESRGMYCHKGGSVVQMYFFDMTSVVSKAKADIIRSKIPHILRAAQQDDSVLDATLPQFAKPLQAEKQSSDLTRLMKEGLLENPKIEMVQLWVRRATQEVATSTQKIPLTREMVDLAAKADVFYLPLWSPAGQAIVGSVGHVRSAQPPPQWNSGEAARLDLAALFSAVFQLCGMQAKGHNALIVFPVRVASLLDKDLAELYSTILRRLTPETRRNVIIDVKGMPKDGASSNLLAAVETFSQLSRAVTFETGLLSFPDFSRQFPKLFAAGFDSEDVGLGEHEQVRHIAKYGAFYKSAGVKAYVKNVASRHVFDAALKEGFTYISGRIIRPSQKSAFTVQKIAISEIGKG